MPVVALMMTIFLTSCPGPEPPGPEPDGPTSEGVYLGIIGFNKTISSKDIKLLDESSLMEFKSFINQLTMENGTGLYYADYEALKKLNSYPEPPKLNTVALVTFTDGLDNVSTSTDITNPEDYDSKAEYLQAISEKINNDLIYNKKLSAYTIGVKGDDVEDEDSFYENLNKLASDPDNVFEAADMNEALLQFSEIAKSLQSQTNTASLKVQIPGGYDDGQKIRITFDVVSEGGVASESQKYIEAVYRRTADGRMLENIIYNGFTKGEPALSYLNKIDGGLYYEFEFKDIFHENGNVITKEDTKNMKLYYQLSNGRWQSDNENDVAESSAVIKEQSSALIMLVLDCTSSLGDQFGNMKLCAETFVQTLFLTASGKEEPTVKTVSVTNSGKVSGNVTSDGGSKVTERGVCWSTNQNPTISGQHKSVGSGTGSFSVSITGLTNGKTYYVRAYATNAIGTSYGEQKSFKFSMEENGHEYVDLGLPSGLKWATCNVGASSPEDYGDYFAWGETRSKSSYTESNSVTYGKNIGDISGDAQYDAARKNWGGSWRMPTKAELQELKNNCSWKWTTQNGVKGYKVTGPNGNSIFLPAAGYRYGSSLNYAGSGGYYWSSTPRESYSTDAWYLYFNGSECYMGSNGRYYGRSVRPVIE